MNDTHETRIFLLKSQDARVNSLYDDSPARLAGAYQAPVRILAETTRDKINEPSSSLAPIAVVYRHSYFKESEDGKSSSGASGEDYVVPLMGPELIQQLEGRLLDYVDATYADKDQRNAQKRVIRKTLWGFVDEARAQFQQQFNNSGFEQKDNKA